MKKVQRAATAAAKEVALEAAAPRRAGIRRVAAGAEYLSEPGPSGFFTRLARVGLLLQGFQERCLDPEGLKFIDFSVLRVLVLAGPPYRVSPTRLAEIVLRPTGGMTQILDRLERDGLVKRSPDRSDRRKVSVGLTEKGLRIAERAGRRYTEARTRLLAGLTAAEVKEIDAGVRRLLEVFDDAKRPDVPELGGRGRQIMEPFVREAGTGSGVVCIHSNASTSAQWRGLMDLLAPRFRVFARDSYDSGKSPHWPSDRIIHLRDEAALIEPVLTRAGSPLALVGHSYGAAVALIAALANPGRIRAMALYEPTLFALLDAETPPPNEADGIRNVVAEAGVALDAEDRDAAAERFIDYWMGSGTWAQTPAQRKAPIAESITNVRRWGHALFTEPTPLKAFRSLDVPVLYMVGKRSTPSAHGVARLLVNALPRVEVVEFENLGHMGPVTRPDLVNETIGQFLERARRDA